MPYFGPCSSKMMFKNTIAIEQENFAHVKQVKMLGKITKISKMHTPILEVGDPFIPILYRSQASQNC